MTTSSTRADRQVNNDMTERQAAASFADDDIHALFDAIDNRDAARFAGFLAPGVSFRFANADTVNGRSEVAEAVSGFFASIRALSHDVQRIIHQAPYVICEGRVTYTRHDASELEVPFLNLFEIRDGLIEDYRIYIDASALYAG